MQLIQITDLHLSDRSDTPAADALRWAIDEANRLGPDLVAFTGDMTTCGTAGAARQFLDAASRLQVPWVFTPGNAELRAHEAMSVLKEVSHYKSRILDGVTVLLPDTSTGGLPASERTWLDAQVVDGPTVILTHYPLETLDAVSRIWMENWLADHAVELYLAGHRHFTRSQSVGVGLEITTRGLDPDKAYGGPPGISLLARGDASNWSLQEIAWPHLRDLLPAELGFSPVGWSIRGNLIDTVREAFEVGLNVLELRPRDPEYDLVTTITELEHLRDDRRTYLSWHLPGLTWDESTSSVTGLETVARQVDDALACGVDAFTIHVPQVGAHLMDEGNDTWRAFLAVFASLFESALEDGVRLSIENVHNDVGTPVARASRKFATSIDEYETWIDSVVATIGSESRCIGAHFDIGHARNNGVLGNVQPLGDWYARIGRRITGYHIHQVRPHEETGKLTNHRDIISAYDRTISYAGFLHAWSQKQINRAPLFVEVRDVEERRRTTKMLQAIFANQLKG
jgi:hypothetical protein